MAACGCHATVKGDALLLAARDAAACDCHATVKGDALLLAARSQVPE